MHFQVPELATRNVYWIGNCGINCTDLFVPPTTRKVPFAPFAGGERKSKCGFLPYWFRNRSRRDLDTESSLHMCVYHFSSHLSNRVNSISQQYLDLRNNSKFYISMLSDCLFLQLAKQLTKNNFSSHLHRNFGYAINKMRISKRQNPILLSLVINFRRL